MKKARSLCQAVRTTKFAKPGQQNAHRRYNRYCKVRIWLDSDVPYFRNILLARSFLPMKVAHKKKLQKKVWYCFCLQIQDYLQNQVFQQHSVQPHFPFCPCQNFGPNGRIQLTWKGLSALHFPDIRPCHFRLLSYIKIHVLTNISNTIEELITSFQAVMSSIS